jgi:hypothetical protein
MAIEALSSPLRGACGPGREPRAASLATGSGRPASHPLPWWLPSLPSACHFANSSQLQPPPQLALTGEEGIACHHTPSLGGGVFFCVGCVLGYASPGEQIPPSRGDATWESRLHIRLLGGSGRGNQTVVCSV